MQVDSSIELGRDDSALEFPWKSDDGSLRYYDLRSDPALIDHLAEVADNPELRRFLLRINAAGFALQTVKCDVWSTDEILPEEEIFAARKKFVCYVDLIFADNTLRLSLDAHTEVITELCKLLQSAPEMASTVEFVMRHCHYYREASDFGSTLEASLAPADDSAGARIRDSQLGFSITVYVSGFGDSEQEARLRWSIALTLLQHALVQAVRK
jgi:hypothetical protein